MTWTVRLTDVERTATRREASIDGVRLRLPLLDYRTIVRSLSDSGVTFSFGAKEGIVTRGGPSWGRLSIGSAVYLIDRQRFGIRLTNSDGQALSVRRHALDANSATDAELLAGGCAALGLYVDDIASPSLRFVGQVGLDGRHANALSKWFKP